MMMKSWPLFDLAAVTFFAFAALEIWFVRRLLRGNREQVLASVPIQAEQEINVVKAGEIVLLLEVPRFGSDFRQFHFAFAEEATRRTTEMQYNYLRAQGAIYGVTTMRVPIGRLTIEKPGVLHLSISSLDPNKDYSGSRVILSQPYLGRMIRQILGIVFCGIGMLLSLLLALWQVFPLQTG